MARPGTEMTVRHAVDRAVALGLTSAETAAENIAASELDAPLEDYGDTGAEMLTGVLIDLGIAFEVYGDDTDDLEGAYESVLEEIAGCTGGLFAVSDVELDDRVLRFKRGDVEVEWWVDDHAGHLDLMMIFENIDQFTARDSPKRWAYLEPVDGVALNRYVFAEPAALRRLGDEFGVTFEFYPE